MSETTFPSNASGETATAAQEGALPIALQEPTQPKSVSWRLILSLANVAVWMATIPTFQILVPNQIAALNPAAKTTLLVLLQLAGGIASILGNLLAGALSDRTTSRLGRRRPWIIAGALLSALSLALLGLAGNILVVALGVILFQFCINFDLVGLAALIPDQVPVSQRATISAFAGLALSVGSVLGVILIAQIFNGALTAYYALAIIVAVVTILCVLVLGDVVLPKGIMPAFNLREFLLSFVRPLSKRDFTVTLIGRLLVILSFYTVIFYLDFYLRDAVHETTAQTTQGVALFQVITTVVLVISIIVSGMISDRLQRRKIFIFAGALILALGLLILAFFPSLPMVLVASLVFGVGNGIFLSTDLAMQTQVLPDHRDNGKDMGILNLSNLLPQILVAILVGIVLGVSSSYKMLYIIAALICCIGGGLILLVRSVR